LRRYQSGSRLRRREVSGSEGLEIETRNLKTPRTFDTTGLPFHKGGETILREGIRFDKADRNVRYDEITMTR
jgi:hypothetical protein